MSITKIRIDRLTKSFGEAEAKTQALADFSLTVAEGEFICVVGPSGCGKTTALRIVAGLEKEHGLFPWMTVEDNVAYSLEMRGIGKRERREKVTFFLDMIGLTGFRRHYPRQLSGGMRQRASLARALMADPEILLMDEPFAALDAQNKLILQDELLSIWEGSRKTVLFITHAIDEAIALGDRIVVMSAQPGRIKAIVPVEFERPRSAIELRGDPRFGALQLSIWHMLQEEVHAARLRPGGRE